MRVGEMLLALEGLALYRSMYSGTDVGATMRLAEMRSILDALHADDDPIERMGVDVRERDLADGYADWATTYDELSNPLIEFEESTLLPILDSVAPGRALDACCGTGRVLAHLVARGHDVVGLDGSPEMLSRARTKVDADRLFRGDIADPASVSLLGRGRYDVVTCCLSLTNYVSLQEPVAGLAAAARRGATIVITDLHPFWTILDQQGFFVSGDGETGFVRNHHHTHADYLDAFASSGLTVRSCFEPRVTAGTGPFIGLVPSLRPDAATIAFSATPFVLVWVLERYR